jgi:CHAT domain-containing protein/tetratricopeptide (TPR) repeat protein
MRGKSLVDALLALPDEEARRRFLEAQRDELTAEVVAELESRVERLRLENPHEALDVVNVMLEAAVSWTDERARANALRLKGNLSLHLGRYQESLTCYGEAREIRARYGERLETARLQVGWTAALKNLARYDEALKLALATREILIEHKKWDWLANLEMNIGSIYRLTDRHVEALAIYEESQRHFARADNPVGAAQAQVNVAWALACQDRFRQALALLRQVRPVFKTHGKWLPLARTDLNLATLSFWLGRYQEAWEGFDRAREAFGQLDNEMEMAIVDFFHSRVYLSLNLFPEALALAQNAQPLFARRDMARYVALTDSIQALAYRGLGEGEKALQLLQRVRAFFNAHQGATWAALVDLERAALLREAGQPDVALTVLEEAAAVFSQHGLTVRLAQAQLLMAECYSDLGQGNRARPLYQAVLDVPSAQRLPTLDYRTYYGLGRVDEAREQRQAAHQHYQSAIGAIESIRRGLRVDEFKASFLDDKLTLYQAAVRLSLEMGRLEEAFDYVERSKSSALLDLLARNLELRAEEGQAVDPQAWERLRALKEEWLWHYTKLEGPSAEGQGEARRGDAAGDTAWGKLRRVETRLHHALRKLQGHKYSSLIEDRECSLQEVGRWLGEDALLIEYFCIEDEILAFLVSAGGMEVCRDFPYSLREVRRSWGALNLALKGIGGLDPEYVSQVLNPLAQRHLTWLHTALIAPLVTFIGARRKLLIVPHDVLYYLPFHAFHDGESYLIERFEVQYAPSAGVLERCYQTQRAMGVPDGVRPALIMGYSDGGRLRYVLDEVRAVAAVLERGSAEFMDRVFQGGEATLERLRQEAGRCRLLHLASHGVFRTDNPLFSFIKLADEPLNVIDIYHLNLNASLVTLSACETGMSQLKGGDLFGLARGCLYAGAPSLVVSLWQVDDASTASLMSEFYRQLGAGERVASALRAAQLALRRVEREHQGRRILPYEHPHYWAPFFLIGADGVCNSSRSNMGYS